MKIYLDIDGTLLDTIIFDTKPANYLKEFLSYMINNHDVYWLTTHCDGDSSTAVDYISKFVGQEIVDLAKKLKPTKWKHFKAEAINMNEDFLWFDDSLSYCDEEALNSKGKINSYIQVNLKENPDVLHGFIGK